MSSSVIQSSSCVKKVCMGKEISFTQERVTTMKIVLKYAYNYKLCSYPSPPPPHPAIPGADFTTISSPLTLTLEDSVTGERCFDIELLPDDIVEEAMECFTVELSLPEADRQSILLSGGTQICCIQDDDCECQ